MKADAVGPPQGPSQPGWSPTTRALFRFSFVYFGLYTLTSQLIGGLLLFPNFSFPALGTIWPMREITIAVATRVFHVAPPIRYQGNSGDTAFYWVQTCILLVVAGVATWVWSNSKGDDQRLTTLHKWFRLVIRFALASQMFHYGIAKVIPTQFAAPSLVTLVEPTGNMSITDLLWTSIGASFGYQMFTGWAEMLGGLLLLLPRTTALGALVCLADMTQVFVLNMTYDFGLKQISFNYVLMSVVLLAPDLSRLADVFIWNRPAPASSEPPLFQTARANRRAVMAQLGFGVYLLAVYTQIGINYWYGPGGGGYPKSALYGIWNVEEMSVNGTVRPPADYDYDRRWRRVIFDTPERMAFERTDDSFVHYNASIEGSTLTLTKKNSATWKAVFSFARTGDQMTLDGDMDDYRIHVRLRRMNPDVFRLLNSRFRWIRPPDPFGG